MDTIINMIIKIIHISTAVERKELVKELELKVKNSEINSFDAAKDLLKKYFQRFQEE